MASDRLSDDTYHATLDRAIDDILGAALDARGFSRDGDDFCRVRGQAIHCISLGDIRLAPGGCAGLGLHYSFLPKRDGSSCEIQTMTAYDCARRWSAWSDDCLEHLTWESMTAAEVNDSIRKLSLALIEQAEPEFDRLEDPTALANELQPELIDSPLPVDFRWGITNAELGLVMARINLHVGRREIARQWVEKALDWPRSQFRGQLEALRQQLS